MTTRPSRPRRWTGWYELAVFGAAYLAYFGIRAVTQGHIYEALENATWVFRFERDLGLQWERAVQDAVLDKDTLVDVLNGIYIYGHWPVLIIGGVALFHLSRPHYLLLRNVCLVSGGIGLVIFAFFPVAPPRLTSLPLVDTITLEASGYRSALPAALVNEYAAMPSFHAGWNLLLGVMLFRASHHLLVRAFAVVMPFGMAVSVIATANHYVIDVFAGVAIVLVSLWIVERRTAERVPTLVSAHGRASDTLVAAISGGAPGGQRPVGAALRRGAARRPARRGRRALVPWAHRGAASQDGRAGQHPLGPLGAGRSTDGAPADRSAARRRGA